MILHQTWKTNDVPTSMDYRESWLKRNPGIVLRLWDNEDCRRLVATKEPDLLSVYDSLPHDIMRADMWRYVLMYHEGGLYADLDVECLKPIPLDGDGTVLFTEELRPFLTISNAMMYSSPRDIFWRVVLENVYARSHWDWTSMKEEVLRTTGPYMLTDVFREFTPKPSVFGLECYCKHHRVGSWWR